MLVTKTNPNCMINGVNGPFYIIHKTEDMVSPLILGETEAKRLFKRLHKALRKGHELPNTTSTTHR